MNEEDFQQQADECEALASIYPSEFAVVAASEWDSLCEDLQWSTDGIHSIVSLNLQPQDEDNATIHGKFFVLLASNEYILITKSSRTATTTNSEGHTLLCTSNHLPDNVLRTCIATANERDQQRTVGGVKPNDSISCGGKCGHAECVYGGHGGARLVAREQSARTRWLHVFR
jgi:hypothetical protein